jgi:hypothetical protein
MVCDMVAAQVGAEAPGSSGWAEYGSVFLSAEVQDLIRARLRGGGPPPAPPEKVEASDVAHDGSGSPKKKKKKQQKKRKLDGSSATAAVAADVSWTICCFDGTTFSVVVSEDAAVAVLKRAISVLRQVPCFMFELFVKDVEDALDDAKPLRSLDKAPLFLLLREASDRLFLETLFKTVGGPSWKRKDGWLTEMDIGDWEGITVGATGNITKIELHDNDLVGPLPQPLKDLPSFQVHPQPGWFLPSSTTLQVLRLPSNQLSGPIPPEFGMLVSLQYLILENCNLSGPIPAELGQLDALVGLFLSGNQLTGHIPTELSRLKALTVLGLGYNELTGPIPAVLGQLSALTHLFLDDNQLTGLIPAELGQLEALSTLYLADNQLTGPIPAELGLPKGLAELIICDNQLTDQEALRGYMEEHNPDCVLEL